jgi:WhiB family transcriptional regulator, redox-sensing transcriptional regulator
MTGDSAADEGGGPGLTGHRPERAGQHPHHDLREESERGSPMQWRDATVGESDTTGFEVSGSAAARQKPDLSQIQAGYAGQLWPLTSGGAAARNAVGRADQLVAVGSGTTLTVGSDPPCRQDPELFFAESPQDVEQAKAMCRACGARIACLAGALERREPCGVWGGELLMRGAIMPRKRPRGRPRKEEVAA